jgi:hypothetical protein
VGRWFAAAATMFAFASCASAAQPAAQAPPAPTGNAAAPSGETCENDAAAFVRQKVRLITNFDAADNGGFSPTLQAYTPPTSCISPPVRQIPSRRTRRRRVP